MPTSISKRLEALEQHQGGPAGFEVWIGGDDDTDMLGPNGETMSRAELDARYPDTVDIGGLVEAIDHEEH